MKYKIHLLICCLDLLPWYPLWVLDRFGDSQTLLFGRSGLCPRRWLFGPAAGGQEGTGGKQDFKRKVINWTRVRKGQIDIRVLFYWEWKSNKHMKTTKKKKKGWEQFGLPERCFIKQLVLFCQSQKDGWSVRSCMACVVKPFVTLQIHWYTEQQVCLIQIT